MATKNAEFAQIRTELAEMGRSNQVYNVVEDESLNAPRLAGQANGTATGKTVFNTQTRAVDIRIPTLDNQLMFFAHEAVHGYQFEVGEMSLKLWTAAGEQNALGEPGDALLADLSDERTAFLRGGFFGQKMPRNLASNYPDLPAGPVDFRNYQQGGLNNNNPIYNRGTAQRYRMAIRVPVNGVRQTYW